MSDCFEKETIVPAIIPESLEHLEDSLNLARLCTTSVQIDIVDGNFVPMKSWPYVDNASFEVFCNLIQGLHVEMDLMIANPEETIEAYLKCGVKRVVIHLESTTDLAGIVELRDSYDFMLGLSISNNTDMQKLTDAIAYADYVQLMGIAEIGSQGQPFDERVIDRIMLLQKTYPSLEVCIDGSVNENTLPALRKAGACRFAVGSALMGADDPTVVYRTLHALID
jgi:ribulose-phosphate 3-epimerase